MTTMPEALQALLTQETLQKLLTPGDLIILALLLLTLFFGARRGLIRTVFDLGTGLGALVLAGIAAQAAAPYMAQYLVTPIVGEVFEQKAQAALRGAGANALDALGGLGGLLQSDAVQDATQPLRNIAAQAAQAMAESLSYFLLFFIFLIACTALLRLLCSALHLLTKATPLGALDSLAGGALGLLGGLLLTLAILWVLARFSPATFSPLGVLSPAALEQTLLTRAFYGLISMLI